LVFTSFFFFTISLSAWKMAATVKQVGATATPPSKKTSEQSLRHKVYLAADKFITEYETAQNRRGLIVEYADDKVKIKSTGSVSIQVIANPYNHDGGLVTEAEIKQVTMTLTMHLIQKFKNEALIGASLSKGCIIYARPLVIDDFRTVANVVMVLCLIGAIICAYGLYKLVTFAITKG
jgi:hypothetical protein